MYFLMFVAATPSVTKRKSKDYRDSVNSGIPLPTNQQLQDSQNVDEVSSEVKCLFMYWFLESLCRYIAVLRIYDKLPLLHESV